MDNKEKAQMERRENLAKFNSVTQKVKPENQNQTHNVRKEGIGPINQKKYKKADTDCVGFFRADNGNRTRLLSLGS